MSWFGEQIFERTKKDRDHVSDALMGIASTVMGGNYVRKDLSAAGLIRAEVGRICNYYRLTLPEEASQGQNVNEMIEYLVRPLGIMRRRVLLEDKWWKNGDGPLLAVIKESGDMCALIPGKISGYTYFDRKQNEYVKVNASNKDMFETEALCFYRPLPSEPMTGRGLILFLLRNTSVSDVLMVRLSILSITLLGVLTPVVTQIVFASIIPAGKILLIHSTAALLVSVAIGSFLLTTVKTAVLSRIGNRMDTLLQNAIIGRLLNLPAKFFADKSSGELSQSVGFLTYLPKILTEVFFSIAITVGMSLLYIVQIAIMAKELSIPAIITFVLELVLISVCLYQRSQSTARQIASDKALNGLVFALFSGIQKIRLSGSENRAFVKWADMYQKRRRSSGLKFPSNMQAILVATIQMIGLMIAYYLSSISGVSVAQFAAFSSAFGMVMAALLQLSNSSSLLAFLEPVLKSGEPIIQAVPETVTGKKNVERLNGSVEVNNVSFKYDPDGHQILDNISLKINPGEYVAIVGKSGCGKSTLMRLLLGFETPDEGSIYYNGWDLSSLELASFRRNVGTVLQNGKLFAGDIFSNIIISAPWLKMEDAWEAARLAGMEEDILNMPMGMNTIISEGTGGISGGQRQRLMIARAIAPKPAILMLDEATSALDNITQKIVSDSLSKLNCTRIVVAHRLSTIKDCDRIVVLDGGRIVEDGTYDELMGKKGFFADLVSRQQVEE